MIKINKRQLELLAIGKDLYGPITDVRINRHLGYIDVDFLDGDTVKHSERIEDDDSNQ